MKIFSVQNFKPRFTGKREDRKTISQLKRDNAYDLNEMNKRRISNAIDNLAKTSGEDNVKFLIDVSENLKYGTNIDLGKSGYNDWRVKLSNAAAQSLALSSKDVQERYSEKVNKLSNKKELTTDEKEILELRKSILKRVDRDAISEIKDDNIRNIDNNLDYFIVSTEIPTSQKLYILKRLDFFMSPEYKINPQLKNRKTQALAEIVNDIVVDTPESKLPNVKSINQGHMGSCAAISICRKALAYEDKPNFVDMVMSELDDSDYVQVYDISKLGSHTKVPINKIDIDFDYALSKGYRILDASALYWMNIADTAGSTNEFVGMYASFDKVHFDTFSDSHLMPDLVDDKVADQDYYRALLKAKNALKSVKKGNIKAKHKDEQKIKSQSQSPSEKLYMAEKDVDTLVKTFKKLNPNLSSSEIRRLISETKDLEIAYSSKRQNISSDKQEFLYIPAETESAKLAKVQKFLISKMPEVSPDAIKKETPEIFSLLSEIKSIEAKSHMSYNAKKYIKLLDLYNVAAAYRMQVDFSLEVPEIRENEMRHFNIPDRETLILQNLEMLIKKLEEGTLKPELKTALVASFGIENSDEALHDALVQNKESIECALSDIMNSLYKSCLSVSKKNNLNTELKALREAVLDYKDKEVLNGLAKNLRVKADKRKVVEILDKYIEKLSSDDCTEQDFIAIYNHVGKKNQMQDFKDTYLRLGEVLFNKEEQNPNIIAGFNLVNNLPQDAPIEQTLAVYQQIGDYFNQISIMTSSFQQALDIRNAQGDILNVVSPKEIILKILENKKEIVTEKELQMIQDRIAKIDGSRRAINGHSVPLKDVNKDLITLTKPEKETLELVEKSINKWYDQTSRALDKQYGLMKSTLDELHQNVGLKTGQRWVHAEGYSGLFGRQQIRIFEFMTDRPYYVERNVKEAIRKIKNSPYSGNSTTSINNKSMAWHAQYIADIAPVEVTTPNGKEMKEALFHDNTWGTMEQDNTWQDETGLLRTDYSGGYGGKLGFITNNKYRNGNLVENLCDETGVLASDYLNNKNYKKLTKVKTPESFNFPMFDSVIIAGEDPNANSYLRSIRENLLLFPDKFLPQLEEKAQKMTRAEIQDVINKTSFVIKNAKKRFFEIKSRIKGNNIIDSGINTKEDYDKLADTDEIKMLFEKMALIKSYNQISNVKIFYGKMSLPELSAIREEIKTEARKKLDYVFGKNIDVVEYGFESIENEVYDMLDEFQKTTHVKLTPANMTKIASSLEKIKTKYGADSLNGDVDDLLEDLKKTVPVKITTSQKFKIANSLGKIQKGGFDGSLDKTIDLMTESFMQTLAKNTVGFENKDAKIKEMGDKIHSMLHEKMDFNLKDVDAMSNGDDFSQNIVKWIDEIYEPATDEEFVNVFRHIQNMTNEEFNQKFGSKITDELLGFKNISGYDIFKKFKNGDEKTQDSVWGILYNEEYGNDVKMSKFIPQYNCRKLEKTLKGYVYKNDERSFDDIYMDYYYSLLTINLHKQYDMFRKKAFSLYQEFPTVPQVNVQTDKEVVDLFRILYSDLSDSIGQIHDLKNCEQAFNALDSLNAYFNKFDGNTIVTPAQQRYINSKVSKIIKVAIIDNGVPLTCDAATKILQLPKGTDAQTYKDLMEVINNDLNPHRLPENRNIKDCIQEQINDINSEKRNFIMNNIDPKYEKAAYELLNNWVRAKMKKDEDDVFLFEKFENFYKKHGIIKTPEKLLNEYLLLLAKPSPEDKTLAYKSKEQIEQLKNVKDVYKTNLETLLCLSNLIELQYILMNGAQDGNLNIVREEFKKATITLLDGRKVPMDSAIGLEVLTSRIIQDGNLDAAIMFFEQLGLSENYIKAINSNEKLFDKAYKSVNRINNVYSSIDRQTKIINEEVKKLGDLNNDPDYLEKLDKMEENILNRCKNTGYRKSLSLVKPAIKDMKSTLAKNPNSNKLDVVKSFTEAIKAGSLLAAKKDTKAQSDLIEAYYTFLNFVTKIKLPLNSPCEKQRDEFLEKFSKWTEYVSNSRKKYSNINVATFVQ